MKRRIRIEVITQGQLTLSAMEARMLSATTRAEARRALAFLVRTQEHLLRLEREGVLLTPGWAGRCELLARNLILRLLIQEPSLTKPAGEASGGLAAGGPFSL